MPYQDDELFDAILEEDDEESEESDADNNAFLEPEEPEGEEWEEE